MLNLVLLFLMFMLLILMMMMMMTSDLNRDAYSIDNVTVLGRMRDKISEQLTSIVSKDLHL